MRTRNAENERRQRELILDAAWTLFHEKGYENVTMGDILGRAECSKGRFYYYFHSKAELLDTLYEEFDRQYQKIYEGLPKDLDSREKLLKFNHAVFDFMEQKIGAELLTQLYLSQLQKTTNIDFWSAKRLYPGLLKEIVEEGQKNGRFRTDLDPGFIAEDIVGTERRLLIDWCLKGGAEPLTDSGEKKMALHLQCYEKALENM